ncbi:DUF11 domain-containing protein [Pseudonocardia acidicola]|uniref:DUF11 domain-containing protein n=1 Tax=Pseudonocardia acidicola TaxID=2724939 RepID=A0ABX1SHQ9_9PSEU|nr:DUF11 domain-containing protein [Pseudonocardia acidicola]NMI00078.1 DUF11 domain-containing protein [Pseudonocardia acidicola]
MATPPDEPGTRLRAPRGDEARSWLFGALAAMCVLLAAGYVAWSGWRASVPGPGVPVRVADGAPALLFQNLTDGDARGRVGLVPLADPNGARSVTGLSCDRVHFAAGSGLCLAVGGGFPPIEYALIFGPDFAVRHEIPLSGLPSRARVSPDGRYGATTVFVTGHSYAEHGFSTRTTLIDMAAGTKLADLEELAIVRDGAAFHSPDVNFWGVTFAADGNHFYATMATGGRTFLVAGDIAARRVVVGRENVECPSLSPDGTRLAFKKRMDNGLGSPVWRFHVLDLATMRETPLAETRSIDDQVEWLDDQHVLYGSPDSARAVFVAPADGSGEPRQFLSQGLSPAVLRTPLPATAAAQLSAADQVTVPATDLGLTLATPADSATPFEHTLAVTNHGPRDATRVVVEDVVTGPATISAATAGTPPGAGGYGCAVFAEEDRVRCDTPRLPAGATWTITVRVQPTGPGVVAGRGMASAAEPDREPGNDGASGETRVL